MSAAAIGYTAAVMVAAVFAVAAATKLRDPQGTADGFAALGLPRARTMALFVPVAEGAVVALLLIVPPAGTIGALVTFAFFTTFLLGRLRAGVRAPCACFGSARRDPLSSVEIVRNVGLMALSALALAANRPTVPTPAEAAVVIVPVALAVGALRLGRERVRRRLDRGPGGDVALR